MWNDTEELKRFEQQYAAAKERKRKRIKKALIFICIFAVVMTAVCVYLFKPIHLTSEVLDLEPIEKDGIIYIYATWAEGGVRYGSSGVSTLSDEKRVSYYIDYENKIDYVDYYFRLEASRWNLLFHPKRDYMSTLKYYPDGSEVGKMWGTHRHVDENGTVYYLTAKCARLFYDNPDGTSVLVWECEEIPK